MVTVTSVSKEPETPDWGQRDEFIRTALRRFHLARDAERDIRDKALDDLRFFQGDQWPASIVAERNADGRPCLTINRLPELASQPLNQQRQGRPQIQVNPRGGGATLDTAHIIQGLTRHIEVASQAEAAYDWAFQYAVICGFGYFQYATEWADEADEQSWDLEIRVKPVLNPFAVYFDPSCQDRLYRDAKWAFVVEDLLPEDYKAKYKGSQMASLSEFRSIGDGEKEWFRDGMIRVAQYWTVEFDTHTLVQLADGRTIPENDLDKYPDATIAQRNGEPLLREVRIPKVRSAVINAREILTGSKEQAPFGKLFPGKRIPIIPVLGEELIVDGKRTLSGIVRYAQDAQRQYNYMRTALTEQIGLSPKAPYIAAIGQIEGFEEIWNNANRKNYSVLPYNAKDVNGTLLPAPQRNFGEPPIAAIAAAVAQADQDLKSTTRIHEPMIGTMGPEQSGRAIIARQNQGNLATFAYVDNLSQSIMRLGEDLVAIMPAVYDRPGRVVRIVKPDQTHETVTLNQPFEKNPEKQPGVMEFYDLTTGTYDITISVGPGYESKRQEFVASVLDLVRAAPQIAQLVMDLVVRHMDWPGATEIADRLKKALPPGLQEEGDAAGPGQVPPAFAAQMEQLMEQHAALVKQLNEATSVIESRRMEMESRERIAEVQARTQLLVAELKNQSAESQTLLRESLARIDQRLDQLSGNQPIQGSNSQQPQPAGAPPTVAPPQAPSSLQGG
jgi:hypothetical protein